LTFQEDTHLRDFPLFFQYPFYDVFFTRFWTHHGSILRPFVLYFEGWYGMYFSMIFEARFSSKMAPNMDPLG